MKLLSLLLLISSIHVFAADDLLAPITQKYLNKELDPAEVSIKSSTNYLDGYVGDIMIFREKHGYTPVDEIALKANRYRSILQEAKENGSKVKINETESKGYYWITLVSPNTKTKSAIDTLKEENEALKKENAELKKKCTELKINPELPAEQISH